MRPCGCNCGRDISHLRSDVKYHPICRAAVAKAQRNANRRVAQAASKAAGTKTKQAKDQESVAPWSNNVRNQPGDTPPRRQKLCPVCSGMPDARTPHRIQDGQIVAPNWICRGCGEPYAPPAPLKRGPVLYSSAGNAAHHGKLYGAG